MKNTPKSVKPVSAGVIVRMAEGGGDVSPFFKGEGRMAQQIRRVNADVTASMR